MKTILFKPDHLDFIDEISVLDNHISKSDLLDMYENIKSGGVMLTLVDDGRIVCIMGIMHLFGGLAECFNIRTKYMRPIHAKLVKRELDLRASLFNRIQTHSEVGKWEKWHELLGFKKEVVLKNYLNGQDRVLWARVDNGC